MSVMKLTQGLLEVNFDPASGYRMPNLERNVRHRMVNGTEKIHQWYAKGKWDIPIVFLPRVDADVINTWAENKTQLTFYPDLINSPGTSYIIRFKNDEKPLDALSGPYWHIYYGGTLTLEEI